MRRWCLSALLLATRLAHAADDIHDIRGPKTDAQSWIWPAVLAGGLLLAVCVYFVQRRWRARAAPQARSLKEQTLERLGSLKPLMHPDTAREFGIAASEVIRTYVERRFGLHATQQTTEEFLQSVLQSPDEALLRQRELLGRFLNLCDLVKFAGQSLATADMEALLQSACEFVVQTTDTGPVS